MQYWKGRRWSFAHVDICFCTKSCMFSLFQHVVSSVQRLGLVQQEGRCPEGALQVSRVMRKGLPGIKFVVSLQSISKMPEKLYQAEDELNMQGHDGARINLDRKLTYVASTMEVLKDQVGLILLSYPLLLPSQPVRSIADFWIVLRAIPMTQGQQCNLHLRWNNWKLIALHTRKRSNGLRSKYRWPESSYLSNWLSWRLELGDLAAIKQAFLIILSFFKGQLTIDQSASYGCIHYCQYTNLCGKCYQAYKGFSFLVRHSTRLHEQANIRGMKWTMAP